MDVRKITLLLALSFFFLVLLPQSAAAYQTTEQKSVALSENTTLYTITYVFGHGDHELHLPILATNDQSMTAHTDRLTYAVVDQEEKTAPGTTSGIILSNATIKDDMYITPKGAQKVFTLVVLHTNPGSEVYGSYDLKVTALPFSFDGAEQLALNPSELKYYTTKK